MPVEISDLSFTSSDHDDEMTAKSTFDEAFQPFADAMPVMVWMCAADGSAMFFNRKWVEMTGLSMEDSLGDGWTRAIHPEDQKHALATWQHAIQTRANHDVELRYRMVDGSYRWHILKALPTLNADGTVKHWQAVCTDIDDQHDSFERELRGRNRVLLSLAEGQPLAKVLDEIIEVAEELRPEMIGSILVLDQQEGCLRHGASRQLPDFYLDAMEAMTPGPSVGSCGTATFTRKRVIVEDIHTSSLWEDYRDLATRAKFRACWSEPILAPCGRVMGTFAMYYAEARTPDARDLQFVESFAKLAAIAIERVTVDDELRQMAAIVDSTDDAIILKNLDGVIERWNPGAERLYGYSAKEALGMPIDLLVPEDCIDELDANTERLRQGKPVNHFETTRMTKDGKRIHVSSTISPVLDSEGILSHFVEVQNDITQRVQAQAELDRERSVLEAIVHGIPDAILLAKLDRKLSFVNESACRIFGYERSEMEGQHGAIFYANQDDFRQQAEQRFNLTATPQKDIQEIRWRRKNGEVFAGEIVGTIIRDSYGKPIGYLGIIRDVTERKRAEATIREKQRQLSTLINNLPGAAYRRKYDGNWTTEYISDGCQELTGYAPEEFMSGTAKSRRGSGRSDESDAEGLVTSSTTPIDERAFLNWASVIVAEDRENFAMEIQQAISEKRPFQLSYRICHCSGEIRWLWEQGEGVFAGDGDGRVVALEGYISDVTELREARERIIQSERLAAVGQMISAIAHESRNALQRIQVGLDMLGFEIEVDSESRADLDRIARAKGDLLRLFEGLRNYAAPMQLDSSPEELSAVWRKAWANLQPSRDNHPAQLIEEPHSIELTCWLDAFRIEQVFRNLFENSLAACNDPVRIGISCTAAELNGTPAVCVSVRDNGPGLTEEQRARIFEAFFTTKSKGTGLGMAIANRIVEAHQGTIAVGDAKDGGAEFLITLPRTLS
ncbi:Sporulation kinase E [Novipirellula aureliae]|uniref:histidine kinase n=1 Tax=Novipirellula aureliae TaxID=2527966 RepID=A0A5C6E422_9BACT|nr:PAS domain S-box protein [Novipirellula aureliae]TWU44413.1 Sporulation kinase E [Novipirellula aureliae]